ncbi:hypothetical protein CPB85DRAFT_1443959 [Mucidula mucida]|nr:hypothetical protein CPB85DRAFT_1443959 [Mucidula mucida]
MTVPIRSPDILAHRLMNRAVTALNDYNNGRDAQFLAALPDILLDSRFKPAAEDAAAPVYTPNAFHRLLLQMFNALSDIYLEDVYQDHLHIFSPSVLYQIMLLLHLLSPRANKDIESISSILNSVFSALSLLLATPTGMQVFMEGPPTPRGRLNYFRIFLNYIVLFSSSECATPVVSHVQNVLALITAPRNKHANPFWDFFPTIPLTHRSWAI